MEIQLTSSYLRSILFLENYLILKIRFDIEEYDSKKSLYVYSKV